jgi:hypothetical protein
MRRLVRCIALAAGVGTAGCQIIEEAESPAPGAEAEAASAAAERFVGRWYALDENMSCQPDKVVTFADGSAVLEGQYSTAAAEPATDDANAQAAPLTLPYQIATDEDSGLPSLVVDRGETKDEYWLAGPDLLALNADGFDVLAHCD